jgi:hypothetical protein
MYSKHIGTLLSKGVQNKKVLSFELNFVMLIGGKHTAFLFFEMCSRTTPFLCNTKVKEVSIVSDYGLDDRAIGVRSLAGAEDFSSSLCVQTGAGAHPASCTMTTGGPFPGGKARPGRDADHSPPSSAEVVND